LVRTDQQAGTARIAAPGGGYTSTIDDVSGLQTCIFFLDGKMRHNPIWRTPPETAAVGGDGGVVGCRPVSA